MKGTIDLAQFWQVWPIAGPWHLSPLSGGTNNLVWRMAGNFPPMVVALQEVLHLLAQGASNQEIARQLVVSLATAKKHVASILSKLGAENRTQAIAYARARSLL